MQWHGIGVQVWQANCQAASAAARKRSMHSTRGATRRQLHRATKHHCQPTCAAEPTLPGRPLEPAAAAAAVVRSRRRHMVCTTRNTRSARCMRVGERADDVSMLGPVITATRSLCSCAAQGGGCSAAQAHDQALGTARPQNCKSGNSHRYPRIPLPCLVHARPLLHSSRAARHGGVCTMAACLHSCWVMARMCQECRQFTFTQITPLPAPCAYQGPVEAALAPPPPAHAPAAALPGLAAPQPPHVRPPLRI